MPPARSRKRSLVALKIDDGAAALLDGLPNKSEFIRAALRARLEETCPLCAGTGVRSRMHVERPGGRHLHLLPRARCGDCGRVRRSWPTWTRPTPTAPCCSARSPGSRRSSPTGASARASRGPSRATVAAIASRAPARRATATPAGPDAPPGHDLRLRRRPRQLRGRGPRGARRGSAAGRSWRSRSPPARWPRPRSPTSSPRRCTSRPRRRRCGRSAASRPSTCSTTSCRSTRAAAGRRTCTPSARSHSRASSSIRSSTASPWAPVHGKRHDGAGGRGGRVLAPAARGCVHAGDPPPHRHVAEARGDVDADRQPRDADRGDHRRLRLAGTARRRVARAARDLVGDVPVRRREQPRARDAAPVEDLAGRRSRSSSGSRWCSGWARWRRGSGSTTTTGPTRPTPPISTPTRGSIPDPRHGAVPEAVRGGREPG